MNHHTRTGPEQWHRRLCPVTEGLVISGDLHANRDRAAAQLADWVAAGITRIVDCRGEWSDEHLVRESAPQITYTWVGTHDDGGHQTRAWFDTGVAAVLREIERGGTAIVHCHMGINRGPSLAFAAMLELGWTTTAALDTIRIARPIAAVAYAEDAICWYYASDPAACAGGLAEVREWHAAHPISVTRIIRKVRETSGR